MGGNRNRDVGKMGMGMTSMELEGMGTTIVIRAHK